MLFLTSSFIADDVMQPLEFSSSAPERQTQLLSSRACIRNLRARSAPLPPPPTPTAIRHSPPVSGCNHSNAAYGDLMGFTAWVCCRSVNDKPRAGLQAGVLTGRYRGRVAAMNTEQASRLWGALICWTVKRWRVMMSDAAVSARDVWTSPGGDGARRERRLLGLHQPPPASISTLVTGAWALHCQWCWVEGYWYCIDHFLHQVLVIFVHSYHDKLMSRLLMLY